jgi:hypothetical protein
MYIAAHMKGMTINMKTIYAWISFTVVKRMPEECRLLGCYAVWLL